MSHPRTCFSVFAVDTIKVHLPAEWNVKYLPSAFIGSQICRWPRLGYDGNKDLWGGRAADFWLRRWAVYGAAEEGDGDESNDDADVDCGLTDTQVPPVNTAKAWLIGFGIFLYFGVTTAWLPSKLILGPLATSSRFVQDLLTMTVWGVFLVAGMVGLRVAQRRGLI